MKRFAPIIAATLVGGSLLPITAALAQQTSPLSDVTTPLPATQAPTNVTQRGATATGGGLGDIIVTARRQAESLQRTPVAVTALSSQTLQTTQVQTAVDLQRVAPSVSIQTGGPSVSGLVFISIRGQNNANPATSSDPAVATYIDGVYIPRPSQGQTDLNDLERIEVLRGPQGTLFGRNTTGGALNIITAQPKDTFELLGKAELGNYAYKSIGLTVNQALAEGLALRVTGSYRYHSGYDHDDALDRDAQDSKSYFIRAKLRYHNDVIDATLSADYNKISDHGQSTSLIGFDPAVISALPGGAAAVTTLNQYLLNKNNWYKTNGTGFISPAIDPASTAIFNSLPANVRSLYSELPQNKVVAYGVSGNVNVHIADNLTLKSITAYRYSNSTGLIDTDGTPVVLLTTRSGYGSHQVSQELQLAGSFGDKFSYILGGYVGREKGYELSYSQTFGFLPLARFITDNDADILNKTQGVFVQGYYKFTDKLRLTAGYRYTWDQRQAILHNQSVLGEPSTCTVTKDPGQTACSQTLNAQFSYPAYTVGVDYQATRNIFVYAKTSAAAKAGGWNTRFGGIPAFQPEKVKDVEIGAKADWFDRHLRTNIALFDSWTKGPQRNLSTVINFQPTQYIVNAGKLSIWGAEFEATVVPWTGMEVSGNLSLMDGRYKKGSFTETQIVNGVPVIVDRSGENLPQLPKSQFSLGATQHLPVSFGEVSLHADYSFIGSLDIQPVTAAPNASAATKAAYALQNELGHIPSYGLLAARVGVTLKDGGLELYLFGRNLTAKKYISRVFPDLYTQGLGFAEAVVGNPRTFGIGANIKFGR